MGHYDGIFANFVAHRLFEFAGDIAEKLKFEHKDAYAHQTPKRGNNFDNLYK